MNLDQLQQALLDAQTQAAMSKANYLDMPARAEGGWNGLVPMATNAIRNKINEPKRRAALEEAINSASGVSQLEQQIAEMQERQRIAEEQATRFETEALYQQHGMGRPEAALRARGLDVPEPEKSPDIIRALQAAGVDAQTPEGRQIITDYYKRGPTTTVNVGDKPDWTNKRNEKVLDANQELWQLGAQSGNLIPSFDLALGLLDKVETGPLTERINAAKRYGQALGMDVDADKVAQFEQLSPIFGELTMQRIQQTKGAVSNKEMEMFKLMNANYEYSTEGNRRLIQFAKAKAERDVAVRQLISQLRNENLSPMEISERVDQFVNENDLSGMIQEFVGGSGVKSPAEMSDEELLESL